MGYKEIVKKDDVRQDAIMEQVFTTLNVLLNEEPATRQRLLNMRTYRVLPLTPESGVIEFVENTKSFSQLLVGGHPDKEHEGLHARYHPGDILHREARDIMANIDVTSPEELRNAFVENVLESFNPAFSYFFHETFPDTQDWFCKRLNYTRSAAVGSIIGYILGIGDRHTNNILIDQLSAELVHIDFGYTFEQGRILTRPETVPFRLTQDIVDGMGILGQEGPFRRSCEEVMKVLRKNTQTLLTILDVCVHDPLHCWVATLPDNDRDNNDNNNNTDANALEAQDKSNPRRRSSGSSGSSGGGGSPNASNSINNNNNNSNNSNRSNNKKNLSVSACESNSSRGPGGPAFGQEINNNAAAERVLLRIKEKLGGYSNIDAGQTVMSVEGQVNLLIREATDVNNLSRLFGGWSAWV